MRPRMKKGNRLKTRSASRATSGCWATTACSGRRRHPALTDVERVLAGQLADMTFCDPPYNVDYANSPKDKLRGKHRPISKRRSRRRFEAFLYDACANILSVTKGAVYVCMSSSELHTLQPGRSCGRAASGLEPLGEEHVHPL